MIKAFIKGFMHKTRQQFIREDKRMRQNLSEKQIDRMVEDSFPCSDPPSTY